MENCYPIFERKITKEAIYATNDLEEWKLFSYYRKPKYTMKKYILIIGFLLLCSQNSYSQLSKSYITILEHDYDKMLYYILDFSVFPDGEYEMWLSTDVGDMEMRFIFSNGNYTIEKDKLILTDSYTKSSFIYRISKSYLYPVKTFAFMQKIIFFSDREELFEKKAERRDYSIEDTIHAFTSQQISKNPLEKGMYYSTFYGFGEFLYCLHLNNNKNYELYFKSDLYTATFSSGKWKRKGNVLLLKDKALKHTFYGLIKENGITLLMFDLLESDILKKE